MHWSSGAIALTLLFAVASSQRGGRRYIADKPLEESLSVENHRFQTRSRGDLGDAGRGGGRRTKIQETTEINARSFSGRSRVKSEEPRQFHSRAGQEQENKPVERQVLSRRGSETDSRKFSSREESRNERFKSRDSLTITEGPSRKQNRVRGRTSTDGREVEYKTRGTESNRFSSRGTQEREPSRGSQEDFTPSAGESRRSGRRDRNQAIRRNNVIETPQNIESVTERFHPRNPIIEETQRSRIDEITEKNVNIDHYTPVTETKTQDLTSKFNSIENEKGTKSVDLSVTEKLHSRQLVRNEVRRSRVDSTEEQNEQPHVRGRKKIQETTTRGAGTESRRRRPTEAVVTERSHSRQLTREQLPAKRGRFDTSPDKLKSDSVPIKGNRRIQDFTSRGNLVANDKRRPSDVTSTEKFHSRQSVREKLKTNKVEDWTTENNRVLPATTETEKTSEIPNKDGNAVDIDTKIPTESLLSESTTIKIDPKLEEPKTVTKQPEPLSTENTVDFPIKSNDVEEPSRTSRKLGSPVPERNNNHHRSHNREFENSKRGRLESSLSRVRSRTQETSTRSTEGRRSSRRFNTKSPDSSKEIVDNKGSRRKVQRVLPRTKSTETPMVRGRQKLEDPPIRHRLPASRLRNEERTTEAVLLPVPVTESGIENKVSTISLNQNEQINEVTIGVSSESPVVPSQRSMERKTNLKVGNRGRGQLKATKTLEEKDHSGEVKDDDNYPEVYKQLKKSGTDPKDILALLKARKGVRENLEKTNSKIPQPHTPLTPSQQPVLGSDEIKTPQREEVKVPNSNFRTQKYKSETFNQRSESKLSVEENAESLVSSTEGSERFSNFRKGRFKSKIILNQNRDSKITQTSTEISIDEKQLQKDEPRTERKYNPYNYQEIRSFNRKKSSTSVHKTNFRDSSKVISNESEIKGEEKALEQELQNKVSHIEPKVRSSYTGPEISKLGSSLKNNNLEHSNKREENTKTQNVTIDKELPKVGRKGSFKVPEVKRFKSSLTSSTVKEVVIDPKPHKELNNTSNEGTHQRERTFGATGTGVNRFRKTFKNDLTIKDDEIAQSSEDKSIKTESIKPQRQTSFTGPGKSRDTLNTLKEQYKRTSTPVVQTENAKQRSKYVPRNRKTDQERFKSRSAKTLEDAAVEPSIKPSNDLYNRNEHSSFRRRSFSTTAQGMDLVSTAEYKNSVTPRSRLAFVPQRRKFGKTATTLSPLPLTRFSQRKIPLSKLFNEDLKEEEEDLRPNINDLSIDSLVSESEQSSFTTEADVVSRKRPRYTESHIQRVPPKRRGSEYYTLPITTSTSAKPEVYTVLAVPYYEDTTFIPETTVSSTELEFDPTVESTTTLNELIQTTTPISTTTEVISTTDTPSTSSIATTSITEPLSSTITIAITTESTTTKTTTTEPTTTRTTTTEPTTSKSTTTELTTSRTTATEPTTTRTTTELLITSTTFTEPTTSVTEATTPTTTTTQRPTTTTTTSTTQRSTTTTTRRPTTSTTTTKKPVKPTATTQRTTITTTTLKTTKLTTAKPKATTAKKVPISNQIQRTATTKSLQQLKPSTTTKKTTTMTTPKSTYSTTRKTTATKLTTHKTTKPTTKSGTPKTTTNQQPTSTVLTPYNTSTPSTKENHFTSTFKIDELLSTTHPNFLTTIAYLARNLTVQTTPYDRANTASFMAPSAHPENTTPVQHQTSPLTDNYVVYGLLPNNNVVRKVVKTTKAPIDIPFYIYGLYPNGTIVRRFPNGTIVPDEKEEENEVIGRVDPGSQESLETVVKKDNPLSYLYPPGFQKTTKTAYIPSTTARTTALIRDDSNNLSPLEVLSIDPRIAPSLSVSNLEKPGIDFKNTIDTSDTFTKQVTIKSTTKATTSKTTSKPTTTKTLTKATTSKTAVKPTTTKPPTKATTIKTTVKPTTIKPPTKATTSKPSVKPTSAKPTTKATTSKTTVKPTTKKPLTKATTSKTTIKPTTAKPQTKANTSKGTVKPTSTKPVTKAVTTKPPTKASTTKPTTKATTTKPTTIKPKTKASSTTTKGTTRKPSTTKPTTTTKAPRPTTVKTTPKPNTTKQTTKSQAKLTSTVKPQTTKSPSSTTTKKSVTTFHKSNGKATTALISDAELLNNLLNQEVKEIIPKGTTESTVELADKVIQLAIERAHKSTEPPQSKVISSTDNQLLTPTPKKQSSGRKHTEDKVKPIQEANANKTGKISVWVIPPDETTTSNPISGVSKSDVDLLNALLSTPNALENLSLSEQLLLADVLSSTGLPQTTKKKKKRPKTTTTTTPPPPAFPILQYLFGRNRGGGGGLFQRGLFRGGGLRGLESGGNAPQVDSGIFQNDGLPQGMGELAAESQNDPQQGERERGGLVNAAINVSRAVSQFMGFVIQGAAQSFQNYLQTRTRALTDALSYPAQ